MVVIVGGSAMVAAACITPGVASSRGTRRVMNERIAPASAYFDVGNIVLDQRADGTPIYVRDVADVRFAPMLRQGAVTRDGDRSR